MNVRAILKQNSRPVCTVTIDQSVEDAVNLMSAEKTSALIVTGKGKPVAVFSERDVFRYYLLNRKSDFSDIKIKSAVAGRLISAAPTDKITDLITVMIKSDLNHLAVIEDDNVLGLIDLKDLVEFQQASLMEEIHRLKDYIDDLHEAGQD
jgi:CBS domain-containing protein